MDDEKENCDLFAEVLSVEGEYEVECAYNGQQALDMARAKRYNVIISDITMPKLDGLTFLKEVKRHNADVEVIMISGVGTVDTAVDAFKSQAFDFLTKPVEIDRLLSTVRNALAKADSGRLVEELARTLPHYSESDPDLVLGHVTVASDLTVQLVSQRLLDYLGIRTGNVRGVPITTIQPLKFLVPAIQQSLAEKVDCLRRWEVLGLKEQLRILAFSTRFLADLNGAPGTLTVVGNVTRVRRLEREKRERERLFAIGEMTNAVGQQIEALLSGINQQADSTLAEVQTLNTRRPNISAIVAHSESARQAVRMATSKVANLFSTLQEFSRQIVPHRTALDVNDLLQKAASLVDIPGGVDVNFDLEDGLKEVSGHPKDLSQILVNLLTNATQAVRGKGSITICSRSNSPGVISIEVTDDGEGIPAENLDRIFEPFFTTRGESGKGLGLALARKVIDDHDGVINVVSQVGKGTTFTITLPVKV